MSQTLLEQLQQRLDPAAIAQIASAIGVSPEKAQSAVNLAVPTLLSALAGNASDEKGASSLAGALEEHGNNAGLANIAGMLGQASNSGVGQAILGHVLGGNQKAAQEQVGAAAGLQPAQMGQLFAMLAPIVMGILGQQSKQESGGAGGINIGSLMQMMQKEGGAAQQSSAGGAIGGLIGGLMSGGNQNEGGGVKGAIAQQGLKALGGFLNRNK